MEKAIFNKYGFFIGIDFCIKLVYNKVIKIDL